MHIRVHSKREEQLVEEVVEACMEIHRSGFSGNILVSPVRFDVRKNLLGRWVPLNWVAQPFRLLKWLVGLIGTSNWIYKNLDTIVEWLTTVLVLLQLSAEDEREGVTLEQMAHREMHLMYRVQRAKNDLDVLLDEMNVAIRQRRSRHRDDLKELSD